MADETRQEVVEQQEKEKTVPLEAYEKLYKQALELEIRYKRLFELYNSLVEMYITQK